MSPPGVPLRALLEGLAEVDRDVPIRALSSDSRTVGAGALFVAVPGRRVDPRRLIADAVARGAVAVAYEARDLEAQDVPRTCGVPLIAVSGLGAQLGTIATRFFGRPSTRLHSIGVTGTNGKTTCVHLLAQALHADGGCGLIGTVGHGLPGALVADGATTPDIITTHRLLADFVAAGCAYAALEVSSHGLDQGRIAGVSFRTAVFTNLSQDHLDYHGDMDRYGQAKARLFHVPGLASAVINVDDGFGARLMRSLANDGPELWGYGLHGGIVRGVRVHAHAHGLSVEAITPAGEVRIDSALLGRFNAWNLLAALTALLTLGVDVREAAHRLEAARPVAGRMEAFPGKASVPCVVVDYAHTPDALHKALSALREHTTGRLVCVFGCGGDRDVGKRPLMGRAAEALADVVVLTDDNPRHENPAAIIEQIRAGIRGEPVVMHDRVAAIHWAVGQCGPRDVVLVAGKGHETTQQVGDCHLPLSDRDTVADVLGVAA